MKNFKSAIVAAMSVLTLLPCQATEKTYGPGYGDFAGLKCLPSIQKMTDNDMDSCLNFQPCLPQLHNNNNAFANSMTDLEKGQYFHAMHLLTNQNAYGTRVDDFLDAAYVHLLSASNHPNNLEAKAELKSFNMKMAQLYPGYTFSHIM